MTDTDIHVEISDLSFKRGDKTILDGVNMTIKRGKITAIMGPSGTGKTTFLKLIGGQLKPSQGEILLSDKNIHKLPRNKLYKLRRKIGLLFQNGALFTNLSVFDNVAFALREHTDLPEEMIYDIVLMKLETVGLRGAKDLMPSELSGGMARRVAFARTIALDPELIMYDEPLSGQDPISTAVLMKLIKESSNKLGRTSIIVSHDVPEMASIADYIYVISGGKIIGQGSPNELYESSDPAVQQFMQGLPDGTVPFHYPAADYASDLLQGHQS